MKCDLCNGTGKLLKNWYDTTGLMTNFKGDVCFMCDGKGTIGEPMTNEEWFCGLSTEEKAQWLENKMTWAAQEQGTFTAKGWEMWLKQPHPNE